MTKNEKQGLFMLKQMLRFSHDNSTELSFKFDNGYTVEVGQDYKEASKRVYQWKDGELIKQITTTDMKLARACINSFAKGETK